MFSKLSLGAAAAASVARVASGAQGDWYPYDADAWATGVTSHNSICKDGNAQSPIDFPACPGTSITRSTPNITWKTQAIDLQNNGHTVQTTIKKAEVTAGTQGHMEYFIAGITKTYNILQCHFHYGSEHFIAHAQQSFEAHCVHQMVDSNFGLRYGVFGVFFEEHNTDESTFLKQFEDDLPTWSRRLHSNSSNVFGDPLHHQTGRRLADPVTNNAFTTAVDFTKLYKDMETQEPDALKHYWNYDGSFTTPPCTEAVDFYIFQTKAKISTAQLNKFKTKIRWSPAGNFRPPQPIKDRAIYGCTTEPPSRPNDPWYPYEASTWGTGVGIDTNAVCDGGSMQSPIDFASCLVPMDQQAMGITWATSGLTMDFENNGHTVVLKVPTGQSAGKMSSHGKTYDLLQCHWHWGSEHTVGGKQYLFEGHCVHQQSDTVGTEAPHYGVFGVFYDMGSANGFLADLTSHLPQTSRRLSEVEGVNVFGEPMAAGRRLASGGSTVQVSNIDVNKLYSGVSLSRYWNYQGSFTTPPCTEAVDFYIMMEPATLDSSQLSAFKSAIGWSSEGGNFRPPQKLHSRVVGGCSKLATTENLLSVQNTNLEKTIQAAVANTLNSEVTKALQEEQGNHSAMLCALVVLAGVMVLVSVVMLALMVKVMGSVKPAAGESKVDDQAIGRTEV